MDTSHRFDSWSTMALCRHYFSLHVEEQPVDVQVAGGGSAELTVSWAAGVLADGDWEVLGAWPAAAAGPAFWRGVWEEFDDRGVDKVTWLCTADGDAPALHPTAKVLTPFRRVLRNGYVPAVSRVADLGAEARRTVRETSGVRRLRVVLARLLPKYGADEAAVLAPDWLDVLEQFQAFYAQCPQRRAVVRKGDEVVEQLSRLLSRSVVRHGPFANPEAATSFLASTLARAEQRLQYSGLVELAPPRRPAGAAGASVAVPGP